MADKFFANFAEAAAKAEAGPEAPAEPVAERTEPGSAEAGNATQETKKSWFRRIIE